MSECRVLKWTVPIDDQPHPIGSGQVIHVDQQEPRGPWEADAASRVVQVWTIEEMPLERVEANRPAVVVGTGQVIPPDAEHLGSVLSMGGALVWHVFAQVTAGHTADQGPRQDAGGSL